MVKLKFTRAWRGYGKGQTADVPGGLAQHLVAHRVAVEDSQQSLIETAAVEHVAETADATPRKRGRKRDQLPDAESRNASDS